MPSASVAARTTLVASSLAISSRTSRDSTSPQLVSTWTTKPRASRGAVGSAPSGPRYEVSGQSGTGDPTHYCTVPYSTRHLAPRGPILTGLPVYTPVRATAIVPRGPSSPRVPAKSRAYAQAFRAGSPPARFGRARATPCCPHCNFHTRSRSKLESPAKDLGGIDAHTGWYATKAAATSTARRATMAKTHLSLPGESTAISGPAATERGDAPRNGYLEGPFAPVRQEMTIHDLRVTGTIPRELNGRFLRVGSNANPFDPENPRTYNWFIGSGMI